MLGISTLNLMRAAQALTMTDSATILRETMIDDGMGGESSSWAAVGSATCRVAPALRMPEVAIVAGRNSEAMGWTVTFPALTDVREEDRIAVGGREFEVIGVLGPETNETARRCLCIERDDMTVLS